MIVTGSGSGPVRTALAVALLVTVLSAGCRIAQADASHRVLVPIAVRNGNITEYLAAMPTPAPTPTPRPTSLAVTTYSGRPSSLPGYHYVYAAVFNGGATTVYYTQLTATYYRGATVMGVGQGYTDLTMLRPGERSTATVITQPQAGWDRYTIALSGSSSSGLFVYVHDRLDLAGLNSYTSGSLVYVVGTLTNNTGQTLKSAMVDVGLYGPDGTIVDASSGYPFSSGDVPPGASASFSVPFLNGDGHIPSGYSYQVRAEAHQ